MKGPAAWLAIAIAACSAPSKRPAPPPPLAGPLPFATSTIAVGETFGCALAGREVRCWGYQVPGLPLSPDHRPTAQRVAELDGAVSISAGYDRYCAVLTDATVRCASMESFPTGKYDVHGMPFHGERPRIDRIAVADVVQVVAGAGFGCALRRDGTVRCWGVNASGQVGDGTRTNRASPVEVRDLRDVVEISAGLSSMCARLTDGTVRCWGGRADSDGLEIRAVDGVDHATQIAYGGGHGCARIGDGTVRCWGGNRSGQLGDGTRTLREAAAAVAGLTDVVSVAAGENHSCARHADGTVSCWGDNTYGEVGPRTAGDVTRVEQEGSSTFRWTERARPARVAGVTNAVDVAAGSYTSCVRTQDGGALCFGRNQLGQLGGTAVDTQPTPTLVVFD
jgi:alpha-tubulin suppressor-like RCC1 family protein